MTNNCTDTTNGILGRYNIASKPHKCTCRVKMFWPCKADDGSPMNAKIYLEQKMTIFIAISKKCRIESCEFRTTIIQFVQFCCIILVVRLSLPFPLHHTHSHARSAQTNLTLLGTIHRHRVKVTQATTRSLDKIRSVSRKQSNACVLYNIPQRSKAVIVVSSTHADNELLPEDAIKARMIFDYKAGKKGWVDQMD